MTSLERIRTEQEFSEKLLALADLDELLQEAALVPRYRDQARQMGIELDKLQQQLVERDQVIAALMEYGLGRPAPPRSGATDYAASIDVGEGVWYHCRDVRVIVQWAPEAAAQRVTAVWPRRRDGRRW